MYRIKEQMESYNRQYSVFEVFINEGILEFISDQHRQTYFIYFLAVGKYSTVLLNESGAPHKHYLIKVQLQTLGHPKTII